MDFTAVEKKLTALGYAVHVFRTSQEAMDYLDGAIDGRSVGIGGSMTLHEMDAAGRLSRHNTVHCHFDAPDDEKDGLRALAADTEIYLSSVNALAETGELVNIDGTGNRVASTLYGHKKVYFVVGRNKLAPAYEEAVWRARNVAAPNNAMRLGARTPCAVRADRCYDCRSPERICRALVVLWRPMKSCEMEILLVDEDLGY